ncbi:MAG: DinB family protein [Phycisphaeraceae bacterium]|nr:DinB family protein [Phycisphaeraceae bacterium]
MAHPPLTHPRLAPPGAGIPAVERFIGGAIFALRRWRGTPESFCAQFRREQSAISRLCRDHEQSSLGRRVLISRLRGLEDSSRFWSVFMTLDHLRIVNQEITRVIDSLTRGEPPIGRVSTAAVKPSEDTSPDVVPEYESSCENLLALVSARADLRTPLRHDHPWFGPLDAAGWLAMAAMHMGIHRVQIARILAARGAA